MSSVKETEKKKKDLTNIEKAKTPNVTKISELKTLINQQVDASHHQLNQFKQYSGQAQTLKNKLNDNEEQLKNSNPSSSSVTKKCEDENKDLLKNKDLKEVFEKKKTDLIYSQKKELDELTDENEQFKNELEEKLKYSRMTADRGTQSCTTRPTRCSDRPKRTKRSRPFRSMTEKLDEIEKHIGQQQQAYREEYENKKVEIAQHKQKINEKLQKIEEDIAKVRSSDAAARADRLQSEARRRAGRAQRDRRSDQQAKQRYKAAAGLLRSHVQEAQQVRLHGRPG